MGDAGLTGRKIIVDTYGGMARHGGGAFSGKDPSKVDRSAAYATRWVAKNVVAAGWPAAARCRSPTPSARPSRSACYVETFGTETVPAEKIQAAILSVFDLRPAAILDDLDLLRPIYKATAAYGHFGRTKADGVENRSPWERTDRVDALRTAVLRLRLDSPPWATTRHRSDRPIGRSLPSSSRRRSRTSTASSSTPCPTSWRPMPGPVPGCGCASPGVELDGFVVERRADPEHAGRLTPLRRVVSPEPVLTPEVLTLCRRRGRPVCRHAQ
jgi:hypothetical protein